MRSTTRAQKENLHQPTSQFFQALEYQPSSYFKKGATFSPKLQKSKTAATLGIEDEEKPKLRKIFSTT